MGQGARAPGIRNVHLIFKLYFAQCAALDRSARWIKKLLTIKRTANQGAPGTPILCARGKMIPGTCVNIVTVWTVNK